jgi:hypothetical protein
MAERRWRGKPSGSVSMVADLFAREATVRGLWDLDREPLSLGGLLLLRAELELLAALCHVRRISFSLSSASGGHSVQPTSLVVEILKTTTYDMAFEPYRPAEAYWPDKADGAPSEFSYQFFDRCSALYRWSGVRPSLAWNERTLRAAREVRRSFSGRLYTAHLKQLSGAGSEQSNANLINWHSFLKTSAAPGREEFLLLGNDELPRVFQEMPGVHMAMPRGMALSTQLALVAMSDGFLGMASGVCAAAILSDVPYVIWKHPRHHAEEMARQIGSGDTLAFASGAQKIKRAVDSLSALAAGYEVVRACRR